MLKPTITTLLPLIAGGLVVAVTVALGHWQVRRAQEKTQLQAVLDATAQLPAVRATAIGRLGDERELPVGQRLDIRGEWLPAATVFLDNRTHAGQAGYHVLTPLKLADGSGVVVVNRGWVAVGPDRGKLPAVPVDAGWVELEARLHQPEPSPFTLARAAERTNGKVMQVLDLAQWAGPSGLGLAICPPTEGRRSTAGDAAGPCIAPWVALQTSHSADGWVRDWPLPKAGIDRHRGYAFQWYALAALAAVLTAGYAWRLILRRPDEHRNPRFAQR